MALHLGSSEKLLVNLNGKTYSVHLFTENYTKNRIRLKASGGAILKDSNRAYLIVKEDK